MADIRIERKRDTRLQSLVALLVIVLVVLAVWWLLAGSGRTGKGTAAGGVTGAPAAELQAPGTSATASPSGARGGNSRPADQGGT